MIDTWFFLSGDDRGVSSSSFSEHCEIEQILDAVLAMVINVVDDVSILRM